MLVNHATLIVRVAWVAWKWLFHATHATHATCFVF